MENLETTEVSYFDEKNLPVLASEKCKRNKFGCAFRHIIQIIGKYSLIRGDITFVSMSR